MGHVLEAPGVRAAPCPWPPPQLLCAWFRPVGVLSHLSLSATPVLLELVSGSQEPLLPSWATLQVTFGSGWPPGPLTCFPAGRKGEEEVWGASALAVAGRKA